MCLTMIRSRETPSARHASTYGRPATEAACPLMSLVYHGHHATAIAIVTLVRLPGRNAERHADRAGDRDHHHCDHGRDPRAEQHPGEDVAADPVGPEQVRRRR